MIDPDFDPMQELEYCKSAVSDLAQAVDAIAQATNLQAAHLQRTDKKIEQQVRRLDNLIRLLEEKTNGQT